MPNAVLGNILIALDAGVVPIVGTTGLSTDAIAEVRGRCESAGVGALIAPNFALGAVLMMRFAADAARYFPDAEIVEMHHEKKLDAPSGTAILTAKRIADGRAHPVKAACPSIRSASPASSPPSSSPSAASARP
jgi:4-hydroxy-tetrahydrodipicolinate reductase